MSKASYDEAKAVAEARRQVAIRKAHRAFDRAIAEETARHSRRYHAASAAFDALKVTPEAEGYEEARQAYQDAKEPADHSDARAELDRAVRAADAAYHAEIAGLEAVHGAFVGVRAPN